INKAFVRIKLRNRDDSMTTLEVILLIFLISFIVLIVLTTVMFCVIIAIFKSFRVEVVELINELTSLVREANGVTTDVHKKMKYFDPLLGAIANVGKGLEVQSCRYRDHQYSLDQKPIPSDDELRVSDFVRFALMGVDLWVSMKERRSSDGT
ncbi:MAG: DUF948 domain-containing protein, partial [Chlamydiota bacterium]